MIKREELSNPASCMSRARDDEMTFVLLGRDAAAPAAIRAWVDQRILLGKNKLDDAQIVEALACARKIERETDWQGPDWVCSRCQWHNFSIRKKCRNFDCRSPRPEPPLSILDGTAHERTSDPNPHPASLQNKSIGES